MVEAGYSTRMTVESNHETAKSNADQAREDRDLYEPDARKSVVVPGTHGALSGTAFTDWVDKDGNLKPEHNHPVDEADLPKRPAREGAPDPQASSKPQESPEPQEPPHE
ncbi:hypothetical protein SMNI109538_21840 [Smaragdicoccus niigatensis]